MDDDQSRRFCNRPVWVLLGSALFALLYATSSGKDLPSCKACTQQPVCFDGLPHRKINTTCCTCPPSPEQWAIYEEKYKYYTPPTGLRTVRLSYTLQRGQTAVDEIYATPDHPLHFPPAYQAFPYRSFPGVLPDHRIGNVGGLSPAFDGVQGDPAMGFPAYDSWLTLGDDTMQYMEYIDLPLDMTDDFMSWSEDNALLVHTGRVSYDPSFDTEAMGQPNTVLIAQVSYNATARGPNGSATAWLGGTTDSDKRWNYAAKWTWSL